jgi:uncharacterized secreted protein with C-terminal beta-propeller domain
MDKWFGRIANASQAGLLLLAAFGYIYTVIPVYEKALLDEEIAKKTLDLQKKESELAQKSAELASLTTAVDQMRGSLSSSQAEVRRLKGTLSEQYSELRNRLLVEFQLLGTNLCRIDTLTEGSFGACLIEKVLPTNNLKSMSSADRDLLTRIVQASNSETSSSWQELAKSIKQQRDDRQHHKAEVAAKCEERRSTDDYKDRLKKIEIDVLCEKDQFAFKMETIRIESAAYSSGENFTRARLLEISRTFVGKAVAR